jgi:hypothetical protein
MKRWIITVIIIVIIAFMVGYIRQDDNKAIQDGIIGGIISTIVTGISEFFFFLL